MWISLGVILAALAAVSSSAAYVKKRERKAGVMIG
jgi:hypothetical protein